MELLIAHLVGDYLLQPDWMAQGKKKSSLVCLAHVLTYMLPFIFLFLGSFKPSLPHYKLSWTALGLIACQHFIQDRTNFVKYFMRISGQEKFAKPPMAPWSIIVVDNTFHLLWIWFIVVTSNGF